MIMKKKFLSVVFGLVFFATGCGGDLLGFDDNKNGIRDDVESYVDSLTFLTVAQRNSMLQMAKVYQDIYKTDFYTEDHQVNEAKINIIQTDIEYASNCMIHAFGNNVELLESMIKALRRKAADNDTRADKVKEFDKLSTTVYYNATHFDGSEDTCFFK